MEEGLHSSELLGHKALIIVNRLDGGSFCYLSVACSEQQVVAIRSISSRRLCLDSTNQTCLCKPFWMTAAAAVAVANEWVSSPCLFWVQLKPKKRTFACRASHSLVSTAGPFTVRSFTADLVTCGDKTFVSITSRRPKDGNSEPADDVISGNHFIQH